ncbi:major facilitator superfamily domain-containing protein [Aspergillus granulosus]|uniref:Major facilitator superfamily domain-containing protein n=1 Tax=Aspergillus granulosus TaxID=176169 RepID=A0ABR4H5H7_9EURO
MSGETSTTTAGTSIRRQDAIGPRLLSEHEKQIEKKLVHKIDRLILPLIALSFFLSWIDRSNYGSARLQNLEEDLNMSGSMYQAGFSVFYIGFILFQIPSNMLLNHFGRPSLHIGLAVLAWGIVTISTAAVHNYGGIIACRIALGCVEAHQYPGMLFYLSKWYKTTEYTLRLSLCFAAGLVANAFGPLIAAGISSGLDGARGLSAWRWLYLIEGAVSICGGILIIALLPDFPHNWSRVSPEMKEVAIRRLTLDGSKTDVDEADMSLTQGLRLALVDKKLYIMAIINICIASSIGVGNFFPTLAATLGYSHIISLLLVAPPYMFAAIATCIHSYLSDRTEHRFWYMMYPVPLVLAGFAIFMFVDTLGVRYFSMFLMLFIFCINNTISAWVATSISRPPAKRAAAYGFFSMVANCAQVWTPFTYRNQDAPHFRLALGILIGLMVTAAALSVWLRAILVRENRELDELDRGRLARAESRSGEEMVVPKEVPSFRYIV